MSDYDLRGDGRVALITGGASGIGRGVAEVFGEAGYRLVLADIDAEASRRTAHELAEAGMEVEPVEADVADEEQVAAMVHAAQARWQRLDFVLNNAGVAGHGTPIEGLDQGDLDRVLAVNLKGPFYVCKHVVPVLREQAGGSILNLASITAQTGSAYYTAYGASKAGVISLTRGLARKIGRYNIRINCLNPGSVVGTDLMRERYESDPKARQLEEMGLIRQIPVGRPARPRDVAHLALFLASPLASHVHGAVLTIDGGETLGYQ